MRFLLFDRIVELKKGREALLLKNVTQSEDYFIDHFPGFPVVPGSIILGGFEQGAAILLGVSSDFSLLPVLQRVSKASFRQFVLPGDQLEVALTLKTDSPIQIHALACVKGKRVAEARLDFALRNPDGDAKVIQNLNRLKHCYEILTSSPLSKVWEIWGGETRDGS